MNLNQENVKITNILPISEKDVHDDSVLFTDENNIYKSYLEIESATVDFVGRYYCVFNESVRNDEDGDYEQEVIDYSASSIYIFVNGNER